MYLSKWISLDYPGEAYELQAYSKAKMGGRRVNIKVTVCEKDSSYHSEFEVGGRSQEKKKMWTARKQILLRRLQRSAALLILQC